MRPSRRAAGYYAVFALSQFLTRRAPGCLAIENPGASFDEDDGFDASEFALFEDDDEDDDDVGISAYQEDEEPNTCSSPYNTQLRYTGHEVGVEVVMSPNEGYSDYHDPTPGLLHKPVTEEEEGEEEETNKEEDQENEEDFDAELEGLWFTEDPDEAAAQATAAHAAATASKLKAVTCAATAEVDETNLEAARRVASGAAADAAHAMEHWMEVKRKEDAVEQELLTYAEFEDSFDEEIAWAAAEFGEEAVAHREVVAEIRGRAQNATLAAARQVAYANARVEEASAALEVASERATVSADAAKRAAKEALAHESVSTAHAKAQAIASVLARKRQAEEWQAATKAAASRAASLKAEAAKVELARAESARAHASSVAAAAAAYAAATSAEANRAAFEAQAAEERANVEITAAEDAAAAAESEAKARAASTKRKRAQAKAVAAKAAAEAAALARQERDLAAERANREAHKAAEAHFEAKSHADTAAAEAASWNAESTSTETGVPPAASTNDSTMSTDRGQATRDHSSGLESGKEASTDGNGSEEVVTGTDGVSDGSVSALVAAYSRSMGEEGAFEDEVERVLAEINSRKSAFESEVDRVLARYGGVKYAATTTSTTRGSSTDTSSVDYTRSAKATKSSASSTNSTHRGHSSTKINSIDSTSVSGTDRLAARGSNGYFRSDDYKSSSSDHSSKRPIEINQNAGNVAQQPSAFSDLSSTIARSSSLPSQQQSIDTATLRNQNSSRTTSNPIDSSSNRLSSRISVMPEQATIDTATLRNQNSSRTTSNPIDSSSNRLSSRISVMPEQATQASRSTAAAATTVSSEKANAVPSSSSDSTDNRNNPWSNVFDFTWVDLATTVLLPISPLAATSNSELLASSLSSSSPASSLSSSSQASSLSSSSMMSSSSLPSSTFTELPSLSAPAVDNPASTLLPQQPLSDSAPGITLRVLGEPFTVAKLDPGSRRQRKAAAALFAGALDEQADQGLQSGHHATGSSGTTNNPRSDSVDGKSKSGSSSSPVFVAATNSEISIVAPSQALLHLTDEWFTQERHPPVLDDHWRCLEVAGPMAFTEVGIMARLSGCLANAGISLLAQSTFDTDYICVKAEKLTEAMLALVKNGHRVQ